MRKLLPLLTLVCAIGLAGCAAKEEPAAANVGTQGEGKAGTPAEGAPPMGLKNGGQDIQAGTALNNK